MPDAAAQKVLVVDDVPANIEILVEALGDIAEILFATRGEDALHIAAAASPDLILLDIMMPGMDGIELLRKIKEAWPQIPVIMLSVVGKAGTIVEAMNLGASDYLNKPFDPIDLIERIAELIAGA